MEDRSLKHEDFIRFSNSSLLTNELFKSKEAETKCINYKVLTIFDKYI